MLGYYDVVLGLIPLALGGVTGALALFGLELTMALPLACLVAIGLIGHALFVRSPVRPDRPTQSTGNTEYVAAD